MIMALKDNLQHIFNGDYPGIDLFVNDVIIPIMGNDIDFKNIDLAARPEYAEKATKAGIKRLIYAADITEQNYSSQNIALFDVTLDNSINVERARVNIQQLIRSVVGYYNHILIVFHYEDPAGKAWRFSYAHKIDSQANTTSAKRYTYVFGRDSRARTAAERFQALADSARTDADFEAAFSVQALSDEFFDLYRAYYAAFVEFITGEKYTDEKKLNAIISRWSWLQKDESGQFATTFGDNAKDVRDYIKKMFGRIVFLYFLQRKGWLYDNNGNADARYMRHLYDGAGTLKDTFLDDVLELLFFYVLNTKPEQRVQEASLAHKDITILPGWQQIPFLNGGLFSQDEIDPKRCVFPAVYFDEFFRFLDSYNFTIDENDQEDAEVGIDPEMLGRIFENLLEDNKDKGAFYTPKEIVDYMCRESIIAYLQDDKFSEGGNGLIRQFVETLDIKLLDAKQRNYIEERLRKVKICDPAIGSGAFPMGLVNLLSKLFIVLRTYSQIDQARMKRYIMEQSIYGVDIEQGAVDIARLRFWLAMVVDETEPQPLPNLHFKIMQGNSLLESYKGFDLTHICMGVYRIGQGGFDFDGSHQILRNDIKAFYNTDNHEKRARILTEIKNNVIRQIFEATGNDSFLQDVKDISANQKFFLWHTWFADVFENGGFDIIIGNPPYLTEGKAPKRIFDEIKDDPYYLGKMNIWYMFACQGIDMLKPGGNLCFIATNNWITSTGAKKLRNKIITDTRILQLCDFHDYMIFDTADIQTMIMQFKKDSTTDHYAFDLRNLLGTTLNDVIKLLSYSSGPSAQFLTPVLSRKLMLNKFFTFSSHEELLKKIATREHLINLTNTEIAQGIVFPQDFLNKKGQTKLGHHTVGDGIFGLTSSELRSLNLSDDEMSLIKPYYTSDEVNKYYTKAGANSLWMIYTPSTFKDPSSMDGYPRIKSHLDQFVDIFTSDNKPYGLHRARDNKFFQGEKVIVLRKCANGPLFSYSDCECYLTQTFNIIKSDRVNLKYLTSLLNSKLIEFWLRNRGKMQGANFQLDKEPLQQIPIIVASDAVQQTLASKLKLLIDSNINESESFNIIHEIDHIVYHLYDLTYDEVLIVDPKTPITREQYDNFKLQ